MVPNPLGVHIACDVGAVRIGVAKCDPEAILTTPLDSVIAGDKSAQVIAALATELEAVCVVVGYPLGLDGKRGAAADRAEVWAQDLAALVDIPVCLHDERLSTVQAQRRLHESGRDTRRSRAVIDSASAAVILEAYLAERRQRRDMT